MVILSFLPVSVGKKAAEFDSAATEPFNICI